MSSIQEILAGYDGLQAAQEAFYRDLHHHPELPHQEQRTAQRVAAQLQQYGCTVQAGIGGAGVVGMLSSGDGPTVLLRADMDALPIKEDTGADYASTATAQDADGKEVPVAHACGHDIHVSCLLGMTKLMADHPGQWNGTLLALFQPAEETGDGAQEWLTTTCSPASPPRMLPWPSMSSGASPARWGRVPGPFCRPLTASRSLCTAVAATVPCRRTPSIRWCSPP